MLAGVVQPTWEWALGKVLDNAARNPGWIVRNVSWGLEKMVPLQPYFVGIAIGLFAAIAINLGDRLQSKRKSEIYDLAERALNQAAAIEDWLRNPFLYQDTTTYNSQVFSTFIMFKNLDFPSPAPPKDLSFRQRMELARRYFVLVGQLLMDGHVEEARKMAQSICRDAEEGNLGALRAPGDIE